MYVKYSALGSALVAVGLLSGCASSLVKPESMAIPAKLTCFLLPVPLESTEKRGLLDIVWNTRLERGPYVSAHEDARGTYFRGPPGTVHVYQPEHIDKPPSVLTGMHYDGGIYVPRDGSQPALYTYFSAQSMPVVVPPKEADCTNAVVVRDPGGTGISVTGYAIGGGIGGAAGGLMGRAASGGKNFSYGQSAGLGAVGGLIGMGLVAVMVNLDVGKIGVFAPNTDVDFNVHLSAAANGVLPLKAD